MPTLMPEPLRDLVRDIFANAGSSLAEADDLVVMTIKRLSGKAKAGRGNRMALLRELCLSL